MKSNQEMNGKDEGLVATGDNEYDEEIKKKRMMRIIIFSIIILVIIAIIVILVVVLRDSDDKDKSDPQKDDLNPKILMTDSNFNKPKSISKKYQLIELKESKYKFLLVHDPKTVNAGLEVRTKFGFDTEIIDGLAHYAEHVFFEGTKASDELEIFNLIGQFDEFLNAYTWEEETVFQFLGSNYTFDKTLNYMSDFITKPLLNETQFTIEVNAVNSEYDTYNSTIRLGLDIMRDNSNPAHAFSQTITGHTGNNVTLRNVTSSKMKEILRNYFLTIFKPENCVFLIYSASSFEEMSNKARKYFNFTLEEPTKEFNDLISQKVKALDNPIFLEGQLGKIATYDGLRETPILFINFQFSQNEKYVEAINLMLNLLDNYKEGTLFHYLKKNNYFSKFDYMTVGYYKNYEIVEFFFYLTNEGLKNVDKVIEAIFASINAVKNTENLDDIINNMKCIEQTLFEYRLDKKVTFPDDIDTMMENWYLYGAENILKEPIQELYTKERVTKILEEFSPDKSFILIDSPTEFTSKYLNTTEILYTRNYNAPYKMNSLSEEDIKHLKEVTSIDDYNFTIRDINDDYTKLLTITEEPCYNKTPNQCDDYNETDPNNKEETDPYVINNDENILSLMKIDRTFGVPFVKGYIEIELDKNKIAEFIKTIDDKAKFHLIIMSLNSIFYESNLSSGGTEMNIEVDASETYSLQIAFSTYNDLLNKTIDFIINILGEPVDEISFNNIKEQYYVSISNNFESPAVDLRDEIKNIFKSFISVNTYNLVDYTKECIEKIKYSEFKAMFENIKGIKTKLKYLTYGDISENLANSTTIKLSSLINTRRLLFASNEQKVPIVPSNSSIYYILKSKNKYQRQGRTLVLFEYDDKLKEQMEIYSYCAYDILFDYIRTKRGSGYAVKTFVERILDKNYLIIYVLGKIYSPEKMDRLVNEAIKETFNSKLCQVDLIRQHLKNRANIKGYPDDKFESLLEYLSPKEDKNVSFSDTLNEEGEKEMTYESIVEDLQEVFVKNVKRFAILYHRGDEDDDSYNKEKNELDEVYYLNNDIKNVLTEEITYLEKYVNSSNIEL